MLNANATVFKQRAESLKLIGSQSRFSNAYEAYEYPVIRYSMDSQQKNN